LAWQASFGVSLVRVRADGSRLPPQNFGQPSIGVLWAMPPVVSSLSH